MKKFSKRVLFANIFGTLGYLFCLISWAWIGGIFLPMILDNKEVGQLFMPAPSDTPVVSQADFQMSPVMIIVAFAITAIVMVVTVIMLVRLPVTIAKAGKTVTTKAADSVIPIVAHGRPLPPAEKRRLTVRLVKTAKLLLVLAPVAIACCGLFIRLPLDFGLAIFISSVLALISMLWFSAQYIVAQALAVDPKRLV